MGTKYKDSGIPWIGVIPSDWEVKRLKEVFSESKEKSLDGVGDLLSLSQYTGIKLRRETDFAGTHEAESNEGYNVVHKGQLVMNIMLAWNGSYALSDYDGLISPAYCVFNFKIDCTKRYFHYLLRTSGYPSAFKTMSRGIIDSRLRLYPEQFYTFPTIFPPLPTQQRIADFLDRKCAEIDELAALQETMIAELKRYKQSVITEAVTGKLKIENGKVKGESGNLKVENGKMKDSGVEWIGEIPERWSMSKLKKVAKTNSGSTPKSILNDDTSNIVWIRTTDINEDIVFDSSIHLSHFEMNGCSCPILPKGTCVVAMYGGAGTIGKSGMLGIDATINQALCSLTPEKVDSFFLFYYLQAIRRHWMMFAVGTRKDPNISQEIVKNMPIPIPPLAEQRAIADYLDRKCAEIDELIAVKQQKIEALKEYKKSVIFEYVTGKREVER